MKKIFTLMMVIATTISVFAAGVETFANLNASGSSYSSGSYTGDNGATWSYNGARLIGDGTTYSITAESIGFGSSGTRDVSGTSGADGVGDLTFSIRSYFTGGNASNRTIQVVVDNIVQGSFTLAAMGVVETHTISAINIENDISIQFVSTGTRQIVLDDVSWTSAPVATPVELTAFGARRSNNMVNLNWATSSELNNDYFSVQHSTDGRNFDQISKVNGAGSSQITQNYSFQHSTPANGLNYYRLMQMDFDGTFDYSEVQAVEVNRTSPVNIFPSHAANFLTVDLSDAFNQETVINVYDELGRRVISEVLGANAKRSELNVANLTKGHYFIQFQIGSEVFTDRFVKID